MLPLSLLNAAVGQPLKVELKSGTTLNGKLVATDAWMNVRLHDVVETSADGSRFTKLPEIFIKGTLIKYVRVPETLLDDVKEERQMRMQELRAQRS